MKFVLGIALIASMMLLASCAHLIPPVAVSFKPDTNTVVFFARLSLENKISMGNRVALWLKNTDTENYFYIYFDRDQPLYAITASPGHYRLMGLAGIDMTHRVLGRSLFQTVDTKEKCFLSINAQTNSAIYLGDFVGYAKVNLVAEEWAIKSITNNFTQTAADFRKQYPNLANLATFSIYDARLQK